MKRLFRTGHSRNITHLVLLMLRLGFGVPMIVAHGYPKLMKYEQLSGRFMDFMGLGPSVSLMLAIFAELFCAGALVLGLATRLVAIPLIVTACVITFVAHDGAIFGEAEHGFLYLVVFSCLLLAGPGKFSLDRLIAGK